MNGNLLFERAYGVHWLAQLSKSTVRSAVVQLFV